MENMTEKKSTIKTYWRLPVPGECNKGCYVNICDYITQEEVDWIAHILSNSHNGCHVFSYGDSKCQAKYPKQRKDYDEFITSVEAIASINGIEPKPSYYSGRALGVYFTTSDNEAHYVLVSQYQSASSMATYKPKKDGSFDFVNLDKFIIGKEHDEDATIITVESKKQNYEYTVKPKTKC